MFRPLKTLATLLAGTAFLLPLAGSPQAGEHVISLAVGAEGLSGARALAALGDSLSAAALQSGKTAQELRSLLLRDDTLKLSRNGRLYYEERALRLPSGAAQSNSLINGGLFPLSDTFKLHSRPGAPRLLILNFQGKTITGTAWNTNLRNANIVATPYDTDGNPATFSDAELTNIQAIWQRVAEDYAPFDVDVTTDVAVAATAQASTYATAVITRQSVFSTTAPGLAYVNTFGRPEYEPAFVAFDGLQNNAKYIAEAISHEFGHRLGLDHDGTSKQTYYAGQGTAPMTWAPIMGNSYTARISQFSRGEYTGANNKQDDFQVISRYLPYRGDAAGDKPAQAPALQTTISNGTASAAAEGTIERQGDVDLFSIVAGSGSLSAAVNPAATSPNLDLSLSLVNSAGKVLATSNPERDLNATLTTTIAKRGTYYIRVTAVGYGKPATNGYSPYGSRGLYRLTASFSASASAPPKAAITASALLGLAPMTVNLRAAAAAPSDAMQYSWDLANGSRPNGPAVSMRLAAPGTYPVVLKVTDADGISTEVEQTITVARPVSARLHVSRIVNPDGTVAAIANIPDPIVDEAGRRLIDPVVHGRWSGAVSGEGKTGGVTASGFKLTSPATANAGGCFTFTVTRIDADDATAKQRQTYVPRSPLTASTCPRQASR